MYKIIIAPILGGIIGYITNDLAIKMLFRPRKSIYIGKFHVPFTPGLIPQQKSRIAKSIGQMISSQLLNVETMRDVILSDGTIEKVKGKFQAFLRSLANESRTVRESLGLYFEEEKIGQKAELLRKKAAKAISDRIIQANAGRIIVDAGWDTLMEKMSANRLLSAILPNKHIQESLQKFLVDKINEVVAERTPDIIDNELDKAVTEFLDTKICDLYARYQDKEEAVTTYVLQLYRMLLDHYMEKLLDAVNIEQIVVEKINAFDAVELEKMIFGVMKRELKAIVYLGAALGFCMGFINLLF